MVKRKANSESQSQPETNASVKRARQKVVKPTVDPTAPKAPAGTRRAKANALENPVWKPLVPGGSRKAAATTITPANKAVRSRRKASTKAEKVKRVEVGDTDAEDDGNEVVSIPVPPAPKKGKNRLNHIVPTGQPAAGHARVIVNHPEPSDDEATASSVTETDGPLSEDGDETETELEYDETDNGIDSHNVAKTTAAEKRFMAEHVFWSDRENIALPGSSTTAATSFVIQGELINISDDEVDDSPTAKVALTTFKKEPLDNANTLGSTTKWPWYTNIIHGPKKDIALNSQTYELKLVIRKAMTLIEGRIRFETAFPRLHERNSWYHTDLQDACRVFELSSHGDVKIKYARLRERVIRDEKYVNEISTLFAPRMSLLRGNTKTAAVINARTGYGLHGGSAELVRELLQQKQYIYPPNHNGGYHRDRPFEHPAILGTLCDDLFSGSNTINKSYPDQFPEGQEDTHTLRPSMVALAATAVYAVIKDWEKGPHIPTYFTANVFAHIYYGHIKDLEYINDRNAAAYNALMRRLFQLTSNWQHFADDGNIIDVENMTIDS